MIFSVPYSGTRTLALEVFNDPFRKTGTYLHFGDHDLQIEAYSGDVSIPVRNPIDILLAWQARGLSVQEALRRLGLMISYVTDNPNPVKLYPIEQFATKLGHVDSRKNGLRDVDLAQRVLQRWLTPERRAFYTEYGLPNYQI